MTTEVAPFRRLCSTGRKKRHGGLSYVFESFGVKFIALWSKFDPRGKPFQPLTKEALYYLREQLSEDAQRTAHSLVHPPLS